LIIKEYLTIRYFRSTMYSLKGVSRFSLDTSTLQFFKLDHLLFELYSNCIFYFKKYLFKLNLFVWEKFQKIRSLLTSKQQISKNPKREKKIQKKYFFSAILQIFLQLKKYSRWKINIQSIFGQH
jgi:hypothetical protein